MPKPDLRSLILAHLGSELEKCERATKGTWYAVVPPKDETDPGWHPGYEDGLLDICIYGGDDGSVAAMRGKPVGTTNTKSTRPSRASLSGRDSLHLGRRGGTPARANAAFIVSARSGYQASLRALKAEVEGTSLTMRAGRCRKTASRVTTTVPSGRAISCPG